MLLLAAITSSGALAQAMAGSFSQQAALTGGASFGAGVALSGDGNTLIVGGGSAAVFTRSAGAWKPQTDLAVKGKPTGGVALSADGNEALVGEVRGGRFTGFTDVFRRSRGTWRRSKTLIGGGGTGLMALSGDGRIVALSAGQLGEVDLFTRSPRGWVSAGRVTGNAGTGFGSALALSEHGVLMVGDPGAGAAPGAVYVYQRSRSGWVPQATLRQPNSSSNQNGFGSAIALSWSGTTALVTGHYPAALRAYLFSEGSGHWSLRATFGIPGQQVVHIALSGNGQRAAISPEFAHSPTADVYTTAAGRWIKQAHLIGQTFSSYSLAPTFPALSLAGSTVALGAPGAHSVDVFASP